MIKAGGLAVVAGANDDVTGPVNSALLETAAAVCSLLLLLNLLTSGGLTGLILDDRLFTSLVSLVSILMVEAVVCDDIRCCVAAGCGGE